jgi:arginyl-tRNA--protein-N-Asp/Glu arginylyltransferase
MDYKAAFRPMEQLTRLGWQPMDEPVTVQQDRS